MFSINKNKMNLVFNFILRLNILSSITVNKYNYLKNNDEGRKKHNMAVYL